MATSDELKAAIKGEETETPSASPAGTITSGEDTSENESPESLSPEEVTWSSLKGSTQDRIKEILREKREAEERAIRAESVNPYQPQPNYYPSTAVNPNSPEVADAVRKLSDVGMATKEEVRQELNNTVQGLVREMELDRLEGKYSGESGLPKFDKEEYQDYISRHPQYMNYTPEDVYQKMYSEEIFDYKVQNQGKETAQKSSPSLRPTKTLVREELLTPELIEQRLKEPDGRGWYERNLEKINAVLTKTSTPEW